MTYRTKPKKRGRPVEPVPQDHQDAIIAWIADGKPLREYCRMQGAPNWRTVYAWLEKDPPFSARFARARDAGADAIAEEALAIIDATPSRAETDGSSRVDPGYVQWQRIRAEYRLKLLAKWNPRRYGDRLDLSSDSAAGLLIRVDLSPRAEDES